MGLVDRYARDMNNSASSLMTATFDVESFGSFIGAVAVLMAALIPLAVFIGAEAEKRSRTRRLERWKEAVKGVTPGSGERQALQDAIDELALQIGLRFLAPQCTLLRLFAVYSFASSGVLFISTTLTLHMPGLPWYDPTGDFTAVYVVLGMLYVMGAVFVYWRIQIRSKWFVAAYRARTGRPIPWSSPTEIFSA